MRLAAQAKAGFYPAHPAAIAAAMAFIRPPKSGRFSLLDPCCGEGAAIKQVAESLGCPADRVYAIELGSDRAEKTRLALPGAKIIGPADFFGCSVQARSMSFAWLNPPFDDESGGGGRVEEQFLAKATNCLVVGGVMALVCPEDVANRRDIRTHFACHYDDVTLWEFPAEHRPYREVIVFGVRKAHSIMVNWWDAPESWPPTTKPYQLPSSPVARTFQKTDMTADELIEALQKSPLRRRLDTVPASQLLSPPMSLGKGHRVLLLTAGHLDGLVEPPGEPPHVIRGTAEKVNYVAEVEEREDDDSGAVTTTTVIRQKIVMTVRIVPSAGPILTFGQDAGSKSDGTETEEGDVEAEPSDDDQESEATDGQRDSREHAYA